MSDTQAIKDKIDIADLIGEYVQLKKAGANFKGCCPFHQEKTPSFMVHPEKQIWHCFGCSKGGDIFTFIQEIEGLDFPEALKLLADRAGVKLTTTFKNETQKSEKNRLLEINKLAAYFFHRFLMDMEASVEARKYLYEKRKLNDEMIKEWEIGFVPEQWDLLIKYLLKKGFGIEEIVKAGLAIKKDGANAATGRGYYDRFRGRIMFPIWDVHGNVVGFTGRQLVENKEAGGKYVNSPQTLIYDKSRVLFGLDKAKQDIRQKDYTVVVEGQMDVIACHKAGMKNVVASSGTALTEEQIKLLKRYSQNIKMAFDGDAAGEAAAKRGIDMAVEAGMNVKVIQIEEGQGKDADEVLENNKQAWFNAVRDAKEVMNWHLERLTRGKDISNPREKQKVADELVEEIARIPYSVEKDEWLKKVADIIFVDVSVLRNLLKEKQDRARTKSNSQFVKTEAVEPQRQESNKLNSRYDVLVSTFWSLVVKWPETYSLVQPILEKEYFANSFALTLYEMVQNEYNENKGLRYDSLKERSKELSSQGGENIVDILFLKAEKDFSDFDESKAQDEILTVLDQIKKEWKKNAKEMLLVKLKQAQQEKNEEEENKILEEIMELNKNK